MPVLFYNAKVFIDGYDVSGSLNQVSLDYSVDALDATAFGNASRIAQGGLTSARMSGRGFWESGNGQPDPVLTMDGVGLDSGFVMAFPDGITEGATSTGSGYMLPQTQSQVRFGAKVGQLAPYEFTVVGRYSQT